jgi:hypothetical protein
VSERGAEKKLFIGERVTMKEEVAIRDVNKIPLLSGFRLGASQYFFFSNKKSIYEFRKALKSKSNKFA